MRLVLLSVALLAAACTGDTRDEKRVKCISKGCSYHKGHKSKHDRCDCYVVPSGYR